MWLAAQLAISLALFPWHPDFSSRGLDDLGESGLVLALVAVGSLPPTLAVMALAARLARWPVVEYLALGLPARRDVMIGVASLAFVMVVLELTTYGSGRPVVPDFMLQAYTSARDAGGLWLFAVALVIAAPLGEEIAFRGFIHRGWAASWLGAPLTVLATSIGWALLHVQYEWFYIAQIVVLGLLFGWLRIRSGTPTLPIVLHACVNFIAVAVTAAKVEGVI